MGAGLEIVFDSALDRGGWPGPRSAAGEAWLGPLGLLDRLELELGLPRVHAAPLERAMTLASSLKATEGFWSRSLEIDGLATAERLLADRDVLATWGWRGEPASARLAALWAATSGARPGLPDRLARLATTLATRRTAISTIRVFEPVVKLPPLWQNVFAALRVGVVESALPHVRASGDLGAARMSNFVPAGDGSLQLLRPHGVLAAAEEVAAGLAASADLAGVVVVGADATLDDALARHGVPRLGGTRPSSGSSALVRLCIESAFQPMDAAQLHALVCMAPGPIPRRIAWRLASALARFPGRGSSHWREAIASGLAAIDDEKRDAVGARLVALLEPMVERTAPLPIAQLATRLEALSDWARGALVAEPGLVDVIASAGRLVSLARLAGDDLALAELRRLCDAVDALDGRKGDVELGLSCVDDPGAILASPRQVVWWRFTRADAPFAQRLRLSPAERGALAAAGVSSPDPGALAAQASLRWRRSLELASEAITFVCPRTDARGEPSYPHPLWDELIAMMPDADHATRLVAGSWGGAVRVGVPGRPIPRARENAQSGRALAVREVESASSIESLLGCSVGYVLDQTAHLRRGMSRPVAEPGPLLSGYLAHHVLASVFGSGGVPSDIAIARATAVLDMELPRHAETLMLPDHQAERATVRRAILDAVRVLAEAIAASGATVRGVEVLLAGKLGSITVESRADLLLAHPDHVIDYKWGATANRERLVAGAAVQLAIYAELARTDGDLPGASYMVLRTARLLAARGPMLPGAISPTAHSVDDMLRATQVALDSRLRELHAGSLVAPSAIEDVRRSGLVDGSLRVAPACGYCELDGLCGRRGRA